MCNHLIINAITAQKWKGGITNDKIYFSEKVQEKVVTTQVGLSYSPCTTSLVATNESKSFFYKI